MTATVIPFSVFAEAREKKLDPKGYASRKIHEAIDRQVQASEAAKPLLIGDVQLLDDGHDDAPIFDKGTMVLLWGVQSDPGDET